MADHLDAPGLTPPGGDPSIDITDIYAFQKPSDASKSILIMNVNPLAISSSFQEAALYDLLVDTDGDAFADIAYRFKFSAFDGSQTVTVRRAEGDAALRKANIGDVIIADAAVSFGSDTAIAEADGVKLFAGIRSDPFFFDLLGFLDNLTFTGDDFFVDKNVFGIVLEAPNSALGTDSNVGVWGRVLMPKGASMRQLERMGRPAINTVFLKGKDKRGFNQAEPSEDPEQHADSLVELLKAFGHTDESAAGLAGILLPDILTFDTSSSAGFLNGRNLVDPVIGIELGLITQGAVTTDGTTPHTDLLDVFPFLGVPH